ncbi:hypothetical protein SAMN02745225_02219 [Ferrithrix thermotolerans DSM 19514]|uniref:Uncharacterized protein n=1 Tax=Ferrithrix thermotolerans DSM 19514 TaxID=1121881 RepID=A0A1M4Y332_9ACTN|nr:hypothetical protein SAMN02745225_02219 [Ferrithrix thermotolerans DSM 19514]
MIRDSMHWPSLMDINFHNRFKTERKAGDFETDPSDPFLWLTQPRQLPLAHRDKVLTHITTSKFNLNAIVTSHRYHVPRLKICDSLLFLRRSILEKHIVETRARQL